MYGLRKIRITDSRTNQLFSHVNTVKQNPALRRDRLVRKHRIGFTVQSILTAAHAITTIQTFITSATSDSYVSACITSRRIALHALGCYVYGI